MPIILILFGIILIDVGIKGNTSKLMALLKKILMGSNLKASYLKWAIAIFIVGSIGYIKDLRKIDIALLILVFIVMLDSNDYLQNLIQSFTEIK